MKETKLIFVYGTLKRGYGNHRLLKDAVFVGPAKVEGYTLFAATHNSFPYMVEDNPLSVVIGEVYEVTAEQLEACDRLEGHPGYYTRSKMESVELLETEYKDYVYPMNVEAYVFPRSRISREMPFVGSEWHPGKRGSR